MPSMNLQNSSHSPQPKVIGVILAAGESKRFGQIKQLTEYHKKTFIENVIETALQSGLSQLIVVLGANQSKIRPVLEKYLDRIIILDNADWQTGQSSSIRIAVNLIENFDAALFLLVDQPQIQPNLIDRLLQEYSLKKTLVLAPFYQGKRGNPVLFDRACFASLRQLKGDEGGRGVFAEFGLSQLDWPDDSILFDVDSPDDYAKLIGAQGK